MSSTYASTSRPGPPVPRGFSVANTGGASALIGEASSQAETNTLAAAGVSIIVRLDRLGATTTSTSSTTADPGTSTSSTTADPGTSTSSTTADPGTSTTSTTTTTTTTTTAAPPDPGVLDFESTGLTPASRSGAYAHGHAWDAVYGTDYDTAQKHSGTRSMKFVAGTGNYNAKMVRGALTLPVSGSVTFERWFRFDALATDEDEIDIFGLAPDAEVTGWNACVTLRRNDGSSANSGFQAFTTAYAQTHVVDYADITPGEWYRLVMTIDCDTNKYGVAVFSALGVSLGVQTGITPPVGTFAGASLYSVLGNCNVGSTFWVDDLTDGA